ncbi:MAG: DUF4037 domain-containing protein [Nocardioides sp.]
MNERPPFVPGAELCAAFYGEVLAPVVEVPHAAGLVGPGSDVLGYDTARSTDHEWGPRATLLVATEDVEGVRRRVDAALPTHFRGWPTALGRDDQPRHPAVEVTTVADLAVAELGFDPRPGLTADDWLSVPQQRLLHLVAGPVFTDQTGELSRLRERLGWYPPDVWWWLVASAWQRLSQEEPFVQRTAEAGDDLGAAVVTARQVRECLRLALLLARHYAPYTKWLGTAFGQLPDDDGLGAALRDAVGAQDDGGRGEALGRAYLALAERHCAVSPGPSPLARLGLFWDRPAVVLGAERFATAALANVTDADLRARPLIGGVDQWVDSTDVLTSPALCREVTPRRHLGGVGR